MEIIPAYTVSGCPRFSLFEGQFYRYAYHMSGIKTSPPTSDSEIIRKLTTVLSADVAEYSRLMSENEEETLRVFREYKTVFEELVALHRGRIFNTAGDAILAEFGSAVEAVRCATEIQSALKTKNSRLAQSRQVRFRIGVNLGDVITQGSDLLGDGVNIAARLQTAAEPGGVCISGSVYDQIQSKLSLSLDNLGERTYKNIPQAVRTFSVGIGRNERIGKSRGSNKILVLGVSAAVLTLIAGASYWMARLASAPSKKTSTVFEAATIPESFSSDEKLRSEILARRMFPLPEKIAMPFRGSEVKSEATWVVDPSGSGANVVPSITMALEKSKSGDTIEVKPGVYNESLDFSAEKTLTLRGLPDTDGNVGVSIVSSGTETVAISAGKVRLENLIVGLRSESRTTSNSSAVLVAGGEAFLFNVFAATASTQNTYGALVTAGKFEGEWSRFRSYIGILHSGGSFRCKQCRFEGNVEDGLLFANTGAVAMGEVLVEDCESLRNGTQGVTVNMGVKARLVGGKFMENGSFGLVVGKDSTMEVSKALVTKNLNGGIAAVETGRAEVRDSEVSANDGSGFEVASQGKVFVSHSKVFKNKMWGVSVNDQGEAALEETETAQNRMGVSSRELASVKGAK